MTEARCRFAPHTMANIDQEDLPYLLRSVSTVDSGYSGQDGDQGDICSVRSSFRSSCSSTSSHGGDQKTVAKDMLHQALQSPLSFDGDITVENSTHVQFGNNTHYHGPVTVLLSAHKTTNCMALSAMPEGDSELVLSATALSIAEDKELPFETSSSLSYEKPMNVPLSPQTIQKDNQNYADNLICRRWRTQIVAAVVATLALVGTLTFVTTLRANSVDKPTPSKLPNGLYMVERSEWLAQPPNGTINDLTKQPVDYVIIHHSATDTCFTFPECIKMTRYIQMYHIESKHWSDIAYNFLMGGDGYAYVGRGWDKEGAHTFNWNVRSIGIAMIGTFSYQRPTIEQMRSLLKLIEYGVKLEKISPNYKLVGVCQLRSTESPGLLLQSEIKTWNHWWNYTLGDSNCK